MSKSKDKISMYERIRISDHIEELEGQVKELVEALGHLYDEQNGPPLIRDKDCWQAAMDKSQAALAKHKGGG